ncbi:MAG: hypothetical protein MUE60_14760 [Candidatus Eisenbacteria bacterium]|jgi:hypothetical protein|nr:hypothetical protein [Candidatus Eisenbacteria bacterium]
MEEFVRRAAELREEADYLLSSMNLMELLRGFGTVYATGSYAYDLMTWRDIDLCLATDDLSVSSLFRLGGAIAALPDVGSMYYRNEFVMATVGNPEAVFWCIDVYRPQGATWKVDVLIARDAVVQEVLGPARQMTGALTPLTREAILRVKSVVCTRPGYRREYGSRAVYRAVLDHGVTTVEGFDAWWAAQRT